MRISNNLVGLLNFITFLLSIPIVVAGVWLTKQGSTECEKFLDKPVIILGVFLMLVSLAGLIGACCRVSWLLWVYLLVMFLLIVVLFAVTIFAFAVTNKGAGKVLSGKGYKEYRLGDYSQWLQKRVNNTKNWNKIKSCLIDSKVCSTFKDKYANDTLQTFYSENLSALQMSNLVSNRRAARRSSQTPYPGGNAAATSTPDIGTTGVRPITPLGQTVSMAPASSTSSMTHPVLSDRRTHRQPRSSEEAQPSSEASSIHEEGSQIVATPRGVELDDNEVVLAISVIEVRVVKSEDVLLQFRLRLLAQLLPASDDDDGLGLAPREVEEDGGRPGSKHGKGPKAAAEGKRGLDPQPQEALLVQMLARWGCD
ncbi:hypothetical protein C1H46_004181 [Malus baccata]|uniref:Uncharacterized protein n=1 Tax=Malus baccata TaxID=106549 RepID=A0A540NGR4_MALBA|nr:hypothetical protein C1H46_004181 [Malus baccata]